MRFDDFIKYVSKVQNVALPAAEAHAKMMSSARASFYKNLNYNTITAKESAVMMLFYPKKDKAHLALIVRTPHRGVHSSQIAFPGGKVEVEDLNLQATALRETHEEIGVSPDKIKVICSFTKVYIPPSNYMVYPFLGISHEELQFTLQADEVADIVELPLVDFLDDKNLILNSVQTSYASEIEVPGFKVAEHFIWGATAMMMSELKDTLIKVL